MVQLKAYVFAPVRYRSPNFNSLMVQLKVLFGDSLILNIVSFQFLDGTIKRASVRAAFLNGAEFQFLDGTIKSRPIPTGSDTEINFNSLMVQLKETKNCRVA